MPLRSALSVALACQVGFAQVFDIKDLPAPLSGSLEAHYAFYVYSYEDSPDKSSGQQPYVEFKDFVAHSSTHDKSDNDLKTYKGLQVSVMKVAEFEEIVNPDSFCYDNQLKLNQPKGMKEMPVYSEDVRVGSPGRRLEDRPHQFPIKTSGIYYLVLSNCGDYSNMTVTGNVVMRNTYGHLPGNEYHKKGLFMFLSLCYAVAGMIWMYLSIKYRHNLIGIQFSISVIVFLGLAECFTWTWFLMSWNSTGSYSQTLLAFTLYSSTAKRLYSFMLVLVASMGWGVTCQNLETCTLAKIFVGSTIYFVGSLFQELVLFFRHSLLLKIDFLVMCSLPVTIWCALSFLWIFIELRGTIGLLKERQQEEKLQLFQRFQAVLVGSLTIATLTVIFQMFDTMNSISTRWYYQWFPNVAVSHFIFFGILVAFIILWVPHEKSDVYAYSEQIACDDPDKEEDAENASYEIGDIDDDKAPSGTKVTPEPIGASAD